MVSNWPANPAANHGVTLIPALDAGEARFRSSSYTNELAAQPALAVTLRTRGPGPLSTGLSLLVR